MGHAWRHGVTAKKIDSLSVSEHMANMTDT